MAGLLEKIMPNVINKLPEFEQSIVETLVMLGWAGAISFLFGILFGVVITVTRPGGIWSNRVIYTILDKIVNLFRSIPFIILMMLLVPVSRALMGTAIGVRGAIVSLVAGCVPFFIRQVEATLAQVDRGFIEAAQSMGLSNTEIIFRVYLKESIAGLARGTAITLINLLGLIAMAGAIGAGGLGNFAIMYGHQRKQYDIIYTTVVLLVILVNIIQFIGNYIAKKNTH